MVLVDPETVEVVAAHDLGAMTPGIKTLGWCRGLCEDPRDPNRFFVAFSILRFSRWREYGFRVRHGHRKQPSRIVSYDVERREMVDSFLVAGDRSLVLFQLDLLPEDMWL